MKSGNIYIYLNLNMAWGVSFIALNALFKLYMYSSSVFSLVFTEVLKQVKEK